MGEKRYILKYCQEAVYLFMLDSLYFLRLTGLCFVSYTKQGIRYDPNENSVKDGLNRLEFNYDCPSSFLLAIPATLFSVLTSSYRSSLSYSSPSVLHP